MHTKFFIILYANNISCIGATKSLAYTLILLYW